MTLAVVETGGKQYKIKEGDVIKVEKISAKGGSANGGESLTKNIVFDKILLVVGDKKDEFFLGKPYLKEAKIEAEILGAEKGKKIYVERYKRKIRYHKKTGHRQLSTKIRIKRIFYK